MPRAELGAQWGFGRTGALLGRALLRRGWVGGVGVHASAIRLPNALGGSGGPARQAHKDPLRVLDRVHMAIMLLNHLDGCAHLFRQEIDIHALGQPERGVGMPEAIDAAPLARRAG